MSISGEVIRSMEEVAGSLEICRTIMALLVRDNTLHFYSMDGERLITVGDIENAYERDEAFMAMPYDTEREGDNVSNS